jgi:hypothetical protein
MYKKFYLLKRYLGFTTRLYSRNSSRQLASIIFYNNNKSFLKSFPYYRLFRLNYLYILILILFNLCKAIYYVAQYTSLVRLV